MAFWRIMYDGGPVSGPGGTALYGGDAARAAGLLCVPAGPETPGEPAAVRPGQ
ncbi:hypothetical protein [Streptomyces albidochromogenes]|uniref:Uncharacterized protein n=1 Tax=Streptomyces albidochromogenes TaxID=329524 RepID=A0ABW6FEW7_9ACTN